MKIKIGIFFYLFFIAIHFLLAQNNGENAQRKITQISVPVMSISDKKVIQFLMDEFFIPETLVTRMEVIDVGKNGFGTKDLIKTFPSDEIYFIEFISKKAQEIMNNWKFQANFQIIAQNASSDVLDDYTQNKPAYNIFVSLLRSLERNYKDYPIKLKLERDSSTVSFEMWDYNERKLKFDPRASSFVSSPIAKNAISMVDSTYYDCIFIYKTIVDTVYLHRQKLDTVSNQ